MGSMDDSSNMEQHHKSRTESTLNDMMNKMMEVITTAQFSPHLLLTDTLISPIGIKLDGS